MDGSIELLNMTRKTLKLCY